MKENNLFAERISKLQKKYGYKNKEVVQKLAQYDKKVVINEQSLMTYKNGTRRPQNLLDTLAAFSSIYNVSIEYLCGYDDVPNKTIASVQDITGLSDKAIDTLIGLKEDKITHNIVNGILEEITSDDFLSFFYLYQALYNDFKELKEDKNKGKKLSYDIIKLENKSAFKQELYDFFKYKLNKSLYPLFEENYQNEIEERNIPMDMNFNTGQECVINSNKIEVTQITELEPEA